LRCKMNLIDGDVGACGCKKPANGGNHWH
jgi:hypothetical protein